MFVASIFVQALIHLEITYSLPISYRFTQLLGKDRLKVLRLDFGHFVLLQLTIKTTMLQQFPQGRAWNRQEYSELNPVTL